MKKKCILNFNKVSFLSFIDKVWLKKDTPKKWYPCSGQGFLSCYKQEYFFKMVSWFLPEPFPRYTPICTKDKKLQKQSF